MNILECCLGKKNHDFTVMSLHLSFGLENFAWGKYGREKEATCVFICWLMFRITIEWIYWMFVLVRIDFTVMSLHPNTRLYHGTWDPIFEMDFTTCPFHSTFVWNVCHPTPIWKWLQWLPKYAFTPLEQNCTELWIDLEKKIFKKKFYCLENDLCFVLSNFLYWAQKTVISAETDNFQKSVDGRFE